MTNPIVKRIELADGRTITLETGGKLAKQADGSVTLRMGNTMLLATVCAAKDATPGTDFMPLQVEYREKFASFGRYPGGFMKREGKPSDSEILTSRLIDRALRPLFPDDYHADVFVNVILFFLPMARICRCACRTGSICSPGRFRHTFQRPYLRGSSGACRRRVRYQPTFKQLEKSRY